MKLARLLIAAVLLAGLAGALWWSNKSEDEKAKNPVKDAKDAPPKILALTEPDIRQIEIKKRDGGGDIVTTIVKKDDSGKWSILAPKPLPADQAAVGGLTSAVTNLTAERIVDDHPSDIPSYGLQPAAIEVDFTMKDGRINRLLLGDDTPTNNGVYAMAGGDPRLFTLSTFNKGNFDKSSKDLRDKRMMTFDQDKISRVELDAHVKGMSQNIEFGRVNQNDWQILKPKPLRADGWQVEELVRKVKEANMDTNASDEDLKKAAAAFLSAAPVTTVKVTEAAGTQTLEVRKAKDDYYAKSSVVEGIHKVTKDLGEGVDKALDDFRNKKLFDFGFSDPTRIEFKDGSKTMALEKSGDKWMSAGKAMDSTSVQAFIDKLRDLAATKFADSGFTTPAFEITVVSNDGKRTEKVQIAAAGDKFIARRQGEEALYQLDPSVMKDLRDAAAGVAEAPPAATPAPASGKKK